MTIVAKKGRILLRDGIPSTAEVLDFETAKGKNGSWGFKKENYSNNSKPNINRIKNVFSFHTSFLTMVCCWLVVLARTDLTLWPIGTAEGKYNAQRPRKNTRGGSFSGSLNSTAFMAVSTSDAASLRRPWMGLLTAATVPIHIRAGVHLGRFLQSTFDVFLRQAHAVGFFQGPCEFDVLVRFGTAFLGSHEDLHAETLKQFGPKCIMFVLFGGDIFRFPSNNGKTATQQGIERCLGNAKEGATPCNHRIYGVQISRKLVREM
jgi:hypothetical protein